MFGSLYIVATPIGNLEDITLRAIKVLSEADIIISEDTRVTSKLARHYNINTSILSYHQHSSEGRKLEILNYLLEGKNIALVTDAGTPGISDPGNELVSFILEKEANIKIVPIPGPSAITAALSVSGMKLNKFIFLGFWPKKKATKLISLIKLIKLPFVFYESPFRIIKTLRLIEENFGGESEVFIARELTKMYETHYRGSVSEVIEKLGEDKVRGEVVVIVNLQ
jgi:16S rRNA (cytidine1402-2'-O)-methyltransferase